MSRWIIFILMYLSIYGSAHLYLLIKIRRAFYLEGVQYVLLFAVLTFLLLAPVNARLLQGQGHWLPAVALTWIGYTWMGFVFIFVCQALIVDGYHLIVGAAQQMLGTDWTSDFIDHLETSGPPRYNGPDGRCAGVHGHERVPAHG